MNRSQVWIITKENCIYFTYRSSWGSSQSQSPLNKGKLGPLRKGIAIQTEFHAVIFLLFNGHLPDWWDFWRITIHWLWDDDNSNTVTCLYGLTEWKLKVGSWSREFEFQIYCILNHQTYYVVISPGLKEIFWKIHIEQLYTQGSVPKTSKAWFWQVRDQLQAVCGLLLLYHSSNEECIGNRHLPPSARGHRKYLPLCPWWQSDTKTSTHSHMQSHTHQ